MNKNNSMTKKEKADILVELSKIQIERFNKTRDIEFRINYALWAAIIAAGYFLYGKVQLDFWLVLTANIGLRCILSNIIFSILIILFGICCFLYGKFNTTCLLILSVILGAVCILPGIIHWSLGYWYIIFALFITILHWIFWMDLIQKSEDTDSRIAEYFRDEALDLVLKNKLRNKKKNLIESTKFNRIKYEKIEPIVDKYKKQLKENEDFKLLIEKKHDKVEMWMILNTEDAKFIEESKTLFTEKSSYKFRKWIEEKLGISKWVFAEVGITALLLLIVGIFLSINPVSDKTNPDNTSKTYNYYIQE